MHRYFDNRWTALVPKVSRIDDESGVLHLMNDSAHKQYLDSAPERHLASLRFCEIYMDRSNVGEALRHPLDDRYEKKQTPCFYLPMGRPRHCSIFSHGGSYTK